MERIGQLSLLSKQTGISQRPNSSKTYKHWYKTTWGFNCNYVVCLLNKPDSAVQIRTIMKQNGSQCTEKRVVPQMKKAWQSKSKFRAMLIVFFGIKGVIMENWVPNGVTVNQHYYRKVLETLGQKKEAIVVGKWFPHSRQHTSTHSTLSEVVFGPETHYSTWLPSLMPWFSTMWLFFSGK